MEGVEHMKGGEHVRRDMKSKAWGPHGVWGVRGGWVGGWGNMNSQKQADGSSVRQTVPLIGMDLVRKTEQATQQAQNEEEYGDQDCHAKCGKAPVPEKSCGVECICVCGGEFHLLIAGAS